MYERQSVQDISHKLCCCGCVSVCRLLCMQYLVGSEVVPSQVDVSTIVNNKPSSYTYRTLGDLLLVRARALMHAML